ncbi:MAG: ABC transporter permease [Bacteroidales bacterium]|nr:ABC transporter permease [Bacteroidales bacterium]
MNKILRYNQLFQLIVANLKEVVREPGVLFWGIVFPILMSLGLGIAFTRKADSVMKVVIIENNKLPDSSSKLKTFINSSTKKTDNNLFSRKVVVAEQKLGNTIFLFRVTNWQDAMVLLKKGITNIVIEEKNNNIEYHFDPMNPDAQLNYIKLSKILNNKKIIENKNNDNIKGLTVSGTRYIDFLIPGLIAMGIMMSCSWGISYSIIERRTKKLLRRMVATPMKKSHFLISLITVRTAMNLVESLVLFLFSYLVFNVTIQGSIPALFLVFFTGNIAFAGISVFISSRTSNTEIGNGLINAVVMPMMVLSGIFFSYHNFPDWSISFIQNLPLTMMADDIRNIFSQTTNYSEIIYHSFILTVTGITFFAAGLKLFKWY